MVLVSSSELFKNFHDVEVEKSTTLYDPASEQLLSFLPLMSLLRAVTLRDQSFISWSYSMFPNLKLVAQNFQRVLLFTKKMIYNEPFYPKY